MDSAGDVARCFEMRTQLTAILGFAELLADPDLSLTAKTRLEYARIVQASGQRLEQAICELVERVAAEQGENAEP